MPRLTDKEVARPGFRIYESEMKKIESLILPGQTLSDFLKKMAFDGMRAAVSGVEDRKSWEKRQDARASELREELLAVLNTHGQHIESLRDSIEDMIRDKERAEAKMAKAVGALLVPYVEGKIESAMGKISGVESRPIQPDTSSPKFDSAFLKNIAEVVEDVLERVMYKKFTPVAALILKYWEGMIDAIRGGEMPYVSKRIDQAALKAIQMRLYAEFDVDRFVRGETLPGRTDNENK